MEVEDKWLKWRLCSWGFLILRHHFADWLRPCNSELQNEGNNLVWLDVFRCLKSFFFFLLLFSIAVVIHHFMKQGVLKESGTYSSFRFPFVVPHGTVWQIQESLPRWEWFKNLSSVRGNLKGSSSFVILLWDLGQKNKNDLCRWVSKIILPLSCCLGLHV